MADFKKLSAVEEVEAVGETANVLIEENGVIKKADKTLIGAQADWAETDESSSAFIKNKPVEKWDLDFTCDITWNAETSELDPPMFTIHTGTFENVKNKILNGVPKIKIRINTQNSTTGGYVTQTSECDALYFPEGILDGNPEFIGVSVYNVFNSTRLDAMLLPDNTIQSMG